MDRRWIGVGASLAALGVAAGAFGAHALRGTIPASDLEAFRTGAHYHQVHAVAIVLIGLMLSKDSRPLLRASAWLMLFGVVVFAGTLYGLALSGVRWLGAITPLGGAGLIAAWICLAAWGIEKKTRDESS